MRITNARSKRKGIIEPEITNEVEPPFRISVRPSRKVHDENFSEHVISIETLSTW